MSGIIIKCDSVEESNIVRSYYGKSDGSYHSGVKYHRILDDQYKGHESDLEFYEGLYPSYSYISYQEWSVKVGKSNQENKMKYVVSCNNQQEVELVSEILKPKALSVRPSEFPAGITSKQGTWAPSNWYNTRTKEYGPVLEFKTWCQMFDVELKPNKSIELTKDYGAVVDYNEKVVKVGCQTIPFSKVEELAKLIKE